MAGSTSPNYSLMAAPERVRFSGLDCPFLSLQTNPLAQPLLPTIFQASLCGFPEQLLNLEVHLLRHSLASPALGQLPLFTNLPAPDFLPVWHLKCGIALNGPMIHLYC